MATTFVLSPRDRSLLKILSWTPATAMQLLRASVAFDEGAFPDERRLRERLQRLWEARFVRLWQTGHAGGGLKNYYKLTPAGFQALFGTDAALPPRAFFQETSPSLFEHTVLLADVIIQTVVAAHAHKVQISRFFRENELPFTVGERQVQPDCFFQFVAGGRPFNVAFEIDLSTESIDSAAYRSVRDKLEVYDAYQERLLESWRANGKAWERPRYRVAFLTRTAERSYHILALAGRIAANPARRLCYSATLSAYATDPDGLQTPIFLDHAGAWQALVNIHPSAPFARSPVRLPESVENWSAV